MIDKAILLASPHPANDQVPGALSSIGGCSLIKRSIMALEQQGIHDVVVVGHSRDQQAIRKHVSEDPDITARVIWAFGATTAPSHVEALLRSRAYVDGPALVVDAGLLFGPDMVAPLVDERDHPSDGVLLVDRKLDRVFDMDAALKVRCRQGRVYDVGRQLSIYDGVAVGIAVVTPRFLDWMQDHAGLTGPEMLREAAQVGMLLGRDINGAHWQQVCSPETKRHAEWLLRAYGASLTGDDENLRCAVADPQRTLSYIEGLLSEKRARHYVLLNPGPVLTSARVKSALVHHDVSHRDDDCAVLVNRIQRKLRRVCRGGPEHDLLLLSGSGTAAMEATVASCVPQDGRLLVVSNGAFGERFAEIAAVHNLDAAHLRYEWGQLVDPDDVARLLRQDPRIVAVVMCHHETSVGVLNPVTEVGHLCRELDRMFFVDAVSSLGAEDVDVRRDKVDVLFSSANKCLHAVSGVSFVCVNQRIWSRIDDIPPRVYYLDLKAYRRMQIPFTPAVSNLFALDAALDELLREGVPRRMARYERLNGWFVAELTNMGLQRMTQTGRESHTITTWQVPSYLRFDDLYEALKKRGYIIYSCKAELRGRYFQVANMGDLTDEMVQGFLDAMRSVLQQAAVWIPEDAVRVARMV